MSSCAVICEFNPLHLGHLHLLSEMKQRGSVICLMSGSFTQRGEAAILSKYERARLAVLCGADLVLELPFPFSAARADLFADAGVAILAKIGASDTLFFGSECGSVDSLSRIAEAMPCEEFQRDLADRLTLGHDVPFRLAFAKAASQCGDITALGSNDILGCFYLAAIRRQNAPLSPVAVKRVGANFDGLGEGIASATALRTAIARDDGKTVTDNVPTVVADAIRTATEAGRLAKEERLFPIVAAKLRAKGKRAFDGVPDITEELASRLAYAALHAGKGEELLEMARTKRYSASRIRRVLLYSLLSVRKEDLSHPTYTAVLAANASGREILARLRKTAELPILTKPASYKLCDDAVQRAFSLSMRADSIWELLTDSCRDGAAMLYERPFML